MSKPEIDPQLIDALSKLVLLRYGRYLNKDQLAEVRTGVEAIAKVSEELRAVKLENGEEPFFVFKPYRGDS